MKAIKRRNYKLNESSYLREFDEPEPDYRANAKERQAYYKRACLADFPETKDLLSPIFHVSDWEAKYFELKDKQRQEQEELYNKLAKEQKVKEREDKKLLKAKERRQKQDQRAKNWFKAVHYTLVGDIALEDHHGIDDFEYWEDFDRRSNFDGIEEIPLVLKSGGKRDMFEIHSINKPNDDVEDSDLMYGEGDSTYWRFYQSWGVYCKSNPEIDANITLDIYVTSNPKDLKVIKIYSDVDDINTRYSPIVLTRFLKEECIKNYNKLLRTGKI
jgi:hypothetical protein